MSLETKYEQQIVEDYRSWRGVSAMPVAAAVIHCLAHVLKNSSTSTMAEVQTELKKHAMILRAADPSISVVAACDLFNQFVNRVSAGFKYQDFEACKTKLIERGEKFAATAMDSRKKISNFGDRFIHHGKVILVHGNSRVVLSVLKHAAQQGKDFSVICTEDRSNGDGYKFSSELIQAGIPVTVIVDSAVAYYMEKVDLVLLGAEAVVESGGIINLIGTYQIAIIAKTLNRPLYVAVESFKFIRLFPLQQTDVPDTSNRKFLKLDGVSADPNLNISNPRCDYTPPEYITLLFTDLGILTTAAISDELIKLYYDI